MSEQDAVKVALQAEIAKLRAELEALQKHYDGDAAVYKAELDAARATNWQQNREINLQHERELGELRQQAEQAAERQRDVMAALRECRDAMYADNPADGWKEIIERADAILAQVKS